MRFTSNHILSGLPQHSLLRSSALTCVWLSASLVLLFSLPALAGTPAVTLSPTSLTFSTQLRNTTSPAQAITLTNTGTATLTITSVKSSNSDFSQTNTCGSSVAAGASCTISVSFTPVANGTVSATLTITDNAAGSPQTVSLTGTGTIVSLSPGSVNFGNQTVGTSSPAQVITLSNVGQAAVKISAITIQGANPSDFSETNGCASVVAGGTCSINVSFTPAATGTFTGTVNVSFNSSTVPPVPATLAGTGVAPVVSLSPTSLTFASQSVGTTSPAQVVTLTNSGSAALTVSSIAASAEFAETNTCGSSVAAGAGCSISVTFTPTASGTQTGSISIVDNAAGSPQIVSLTGTGSSTPAVSFSPSSLAFSSQPLHTISAAQNITLTNTGGSALTITSITIVGTNSGDFLQSNTCGSSVAAGAACTISVQFQPTATGTRTASVSVTDNATGSPQSAGLSGIAPDPLPYVQAPSVPTAVAPGSSGFTLTLNGAQFVPGSSVLFNGSARATTFVNQNQIKATLLSSDVATAGTTQLVVTNPSPGGGTSNSQPFEITNPISTVSMSGSTLAVGVDPRGIAVANFAGDNNVGTPGIAVVNRGSNAVSILLGNGNGTFSNAANYATDVDPIALAVGDFNGDGIPDLVTANRASYTISILLGNGDGTFQSHVDYPAGTEPMAVVVGDFNGDGYLDVAEVNSADNTLAVYLGVGNGTLQPAVIYAVGSDPIAIVTGDFNGDGILDIAVANSGSDNVAVLFGNGNGTFQSAVYYSTGSDPDGLFTADLNGDGKLDLVVANNGSNTISVLLNSGNGTFAPNVAYAVGTLPFAISGGDFFGNGMIDIAVVNNGGNTVSIVPGNGNGTFNAAGTFTFATGNEPIGIAVGDFNLDGRADLVVSNSEDNTISVLMQVPAATLSTSSLAFGSENTGSSSAPQTVVLTNSGSASLSITSIAVTGASSSQFLETNNCGGVLAAGSNCTVSVTFVPTVSGTASAAVTITDNAAGSPQTVSLLGTGVAPAVLLSPTNLTFASQIVGTTSPAQTVTLTNSGSAALAITSITASAEYAQTNTCGTSVAAGAACSISVTFTPTATGTQTGTVTIVDNAGSSQVVNLTGSGSGAPAVSLSPASLTFSSQAVDTTSAAQTFTLTNTGSGPLTIISVATTGSYSQTNTCGTSVAAGVNCTISVFFTPTATGTQSGTVVVADNASNSPQTVTMAGTGATDAVALSPTSLSFGNQAVNTSSTTKAIKLTNNTGGKLTISKIAASANYSETNTCGTGGGAGGTCSIIVTFTPTTTGTLPGTITITDSATNSPQTVPLSGTGIAASVVFSPSSLTFADQTVGTSSAASVVTLSNTGTAVLTISSVAITGTNSGDYSQTNNCGGTVAAGGSCAISAVFTPTAAGTRSASITVTDSASGSPQSIPLGGTGVAPVIGLAPTSVSFANQAVGTTSAASTETLSNSGSATLTISSISITGTNSGDFAETNNCGSSLAAATSCAISVTFSPTASGTRQASISVSDNSAGSPQTVALTGTGTAPAVSFSASTITFGGQAVGSSSPPSGVSLFNTGNALLSISSITITGANAGDFSQTNTCGVSVAAGGSCNINVVFTPTASGTRTATVSIADNVTGSPQSISLTGTGTTGGPAATISPLSLTFASQNLLTTSAAQTVTLTNTGAAAMSITSIVASGDYAQTNNCGASLAAAAKCTINITFSPSWTGSRAGYITFSDNDPSTLQTVTLNGTGASPSSTVSISPLQASVTPGQSTQFSASISGVASSNVTWAVDGITGGNGSVGTISSGLYTAPSAAGSHVVTATSTANTTQSASVPVIVTSYAGTFVYHNDNGRTGQNLDETVLTTGNVNETQFGKLFSCPVDGQIYGEPLYVQGVSFPGNSSVPAGTYNVVYVATENDSLYAFDADGAGCTQLWQVSFLTNGAQTLNTNDIGGCANISPKVGITSTPVIDPALNEIFVLARTKTGSSGNYTYYQTLYALEITSGTIVQSTQIQASVSSTNGTVTFNPQTQNQRAGLFVLNGNVYAAWASHCDIQPYHGWLMAYQESNLQQVSVFNTTPNGVEGGIWQSGAAPAVDEYGDIYFMNGNGTFDINTGGVDYGEGLMKLSLSGNSLAVEDYFVPSNYQTLNASDLDLGSGGPLLIPTQPTPPTQMLVAAGKQGMVYLVNQTDLGEYNPSSNQVIQTLPAGTVPTAHSMAAYWQNNIYFCGVGNNVQSYLLSNGMLSTSPTSQSPETFGYPGATPAISANGAGEGIVWAVSTVQGYPALLRVYDAANLSRELYNSDQNATRDQAGMAVKFAVPTVANGKVYLGTQTELDVYGLLPNP